MSIAWATVVLVVLLIPGFLFFWGFYAPTQVTRETVPVSPLGQLAGVVVISFFLHATAYSLINSQVACRAAEADATPQACVDFDQLAALLRIDGSPPAGRKLPSLNRMLDENAPRILAYFMLLGGLGFLVGYAAGKAVEWGLLPLSRHQYLRMLEDGRRDRSSDAAEGWVRAHVLSRTAHDGRILIYDGLVRDFYSKADGTISYIVLRDARRGLLILAESTQGSGAVRQPLGTGRFVESLDGLLVLTSEDIANVYLERLSDLSVDPAAERALDAALAAAAAAERPDEHVTGG